MNWRKRWRAFYQRWALKLAVPRIPDQATIVVFVTVSSALLKSDPERSADLVADSAGKAARATVLKVGGSV